MTNMLTDTDLTVIEDLDFEPGCEIGQTMERGTHPAPCGNPAEWVAHCTRACGCSSMRLLCGDHLSGWMAKMTDARKSNWLCVTCYAANLSAPIIDRIEPLR